MSNQIGIPCAVTPAEVVRERTLGGAIELCAKAAGFTLDKTLQQQLGVDKAQFSRWQSGEEGIKWPKFEQLMDFCGNDAPLMWMLHARGYDLHSIRRQETKVESDNRRLREENAALRRVLLGSSAE